MPPIPPNIIEINIPANWYPPWVVEVLLNNKYYYTFYLLP